MLCRRGLLIRGNVSAAYQKVAPIARIFFHFMPNIGRKGFIGAQIVRGVFF